MDRQQQKAERLPPVISAPDVRLLMRDHIIQLVAVHVIREIDFGLDDPQHERRADIFALIDILPQDHRSADLAPQTPVAHSGIEKKCCYSEKPKPR